jgi:hypothetical protein
MGFRERVRVRLITTHPLRYEKIQRPIFKSPALPFFFLFDHFQPILNGFRLIETSFFVEFYNR